MTGLNNRRSHRSWSWVAAPGLAEGSAGIALMVCQRSTSLQVFEFLERPRPVRAKQPRQPPIGEQPPPCLAHRAVVALVGRILDSLNRGAAPWARLTELPVHGHCRAKRGDLL